MATKSNWTKKNEYGNYKEYRNIDNRNKGIIAEAKALGYGKRAGSAPIGKLINFINQQKSSISKYKA